MICSKCGKHIPEPSYNAKIQILDCKRGHKVRLFMPEIEKRYYPKRNDKINKEVYGNG